MAEVDDQDLMKWLEKEGVIFCEPMCYYSVLDVMDQLGVSRRKVLDWIEEGKLQGLRRGNRWEFTWSQISAFLESIGVEHDEKHWLSGRKARLERQRSRMGGFKGSQ